MKRKSNNISNSKFHIYFIELFILYISNFLLFWLSRIISIDFVIFPFVILVAPEYLSFYKLYFINIILTFDFNCLLIFTRSTIPHKMKQSRFRTAAFSVASSLVSAGHYLIICNKFSDAGLSAIITGASSLVESLLLKRYEFIWIPYHSWIWLYILIAFCHVVSIVGGRQAKLNLHFVDEFMKCLLWMSFVLSFSMSPPCKSI